MKKAIFLILSVFTMSSLIFGQQEVFTNTGRKVFLWDDGTWMYVDSTSLNKIKPIVISKLEIPKILPNDTVITHTGYSLLYNETHEQANWVAYKLTKAKAGGSFGRTNKFIPDPMVATGTATNKDYEKNGYDRGHLAPAADMKWSEIAIAESFYFSNMSPQLPSFNRGIWKKLEDLVRSWAQENDSIYIVTGPVLTPDLDYIGPNKVSVPKYFYKVILDYTKPSIKGIGFILSNESSSEPLQKFAVSIDSVETLTGIDFFPLLPNKHQTLIKNILCIKC